MPHGGGHHGGGHHGGGHHGGGHHGGGFGGGHHRHHGGWGHSHHHHHGGYYGSGWYYYRRRPVTWVVLSVILVVVIIISATVTVRYTASDYTDDDGLHYAATDTRIIPVSNALCQGLELTVNKALSGSTASLSLLDTRPKLNGNEKFFISDSPYLGYLDYEYYYFYMYPGSNFTVSACISDGYTAYATFNMIKGNGRFNSWRDDPYHVKDSFQINAQCNSGQNNSHTYHVKDEDYYYLIYDADYIQATQLTVNMNFHRTRYEVAGNVSTGDTCSVVGGSQGDSCSISVPMSGKTAFLEVTPMADTDINWKDGVGLDTKCIPRVWMYVVIALSILVGLVAILVPLLACIIIKLRKMNKATPTTTASAAVVTDTAPLIAAPPPANPDFQEPPPAYGSNYTAPPQYKA